MKTFKNSVALMVVTWLGGIMGASADDAVAKNSDDTSLDYPKYRSQELSIDLFGSGSVGQETINHISGSRLRHDGLVGGGGGITYFFLRYLGVGGDFDAEGRHHFFDSASGNIYARLPIANTGLAPYIYGGGGYQFQDVSQSFGQAGAGLEFRFCRHVGIFVDGRYVIANRTDNYGLARAGLRVTF